MTTPTTAAPAEWDMEPTALVADITAPGSGVGWVTLPHGETIDFLISKETTDGKTTWLVFESTPLL